MRSTLAPFILSAMLFLAVPGFAQISHTSEEQHAQEQEIALKEAKKTKASYKKTHLNTSKYTFRKGEAPYKQVKEKEKFKFDEYGDPVKPKKKFWKRKRTLKQTI